MASVPETVIRALSTHGLSSLTSSIARTSSSLVIEKLTPQAHPLVDVVVDAIVAVPEDHRAVAHAQVDVLVAVHVPDLAALAAVDVDRVLAPGAEVGVGAAGERLERPAVHLELALGVEVRGRSAGRDRRS